MKGGFILLLLLLPSVAAVAEEVLSVRQVLIAPRRLNTPAVAAEATAATRGTGGQPDAVNAQRVIARLTFPKNSMRLSAETRRQLKALAPKKNTALRVTGFADDDSGRRERLANLRARAIASYLEEYAGITKIEIRWLKTTHPDFPQTGATVEEKE